MGHEAEPVGNEVAKRSVPRDHEVHPGRGGEKLFDPLLRRETARKEDLGGLGLDAHGLRDLDAVRDDADIAGATARGRVSERGRDADHDTSPADDRPEEAREPARELEVCEPPGRPRAVQREDERPASEHAHGSRGQPVRVDEVAAAGSAAHGADHRDQQERGEPRPALQVVDEAASVREAEVAVRRVM